MTSSTVRTFDDPDQYITAIRQGISEVTLTARGHFAAKLTRIDLHQVWMQRFFETMPRIKHVTDPGGRAIVVFPTEPRLRQSWKGVEVQPTDLMRLNEGFSYYQHSAGISSYASMSLPMAEIASVGAAIAGQDLSPPRDALIVVPSPSAMTKLQRLHAAAGLLAETAPDIIANHGAARGLEQALIEAMVDCLATADTGEERSSQRRHERIMRRFHRLIEGQANQALYVPEICKAIGVAERTLRICCQEQLKMSPKQFLLKRRINMVRRDLKRAPPATTTVTEIVARYGFWDFGRFAAVYRSLFAELPSATLARAPE
jgi:AraC-like DNA-binding protein